MKNDSYIAGLDEAGRGPLAGPLVFAMVAVKKKDYQLLLQNILSCHKILKDSKKLSLPDRLLWRSFLYGMKAEGKVIFHHCSINSVEIDKKGLTRASQFCVRHLLNNNLSYQDRVLLDGGLIAPPEYIHQETIIKGDEKEILISLASIIAKTTRDMKLNHLAKKFPVYDFDKHKGYGTKKHKEKIRLHGLCPEHRRSFLKNIICG